MGLLSWRPWRRSLENPSTTLANPAAWLVKMFGNESDAGVEVTPGTSLTVATWWQCIRLLTDDCAKLPTYVYKRDDQKGHTRDRHHQAYYLLRRKVNEYMTAGTFKRTILLHALQYGNGYAWITRDASAAPIELILLNPEKTCPFWHQGKLYYETWIDGTRHILDSMDVFHLRGLGFDGTKGYSVIEYAANSLGLTIAAEKFGSKHFSNGSKASGVLHYPGRLKPEAKQNLGESFEKAHRGIDNAHRTIILEEGAKFVPLSIPPNEAQYIELREFQRKEIGSWFKIPPSKLGDPDSVSYNSLEQWNQAYLESALDPWLCAFEEEAFDKLLTEVQKKRESHFVEFNRSALLRTDLKSRYEAYKIAREWGWMSSNDIRRKENESPIGPEGDVYLTPLNMTNLSVMLNPPEEEQEGDEPEDDIDGQDEQDKGKKEKDRAIRDLLADSYGRMIRRLTGSLEKAAKREDFQAKLPELLADYEQAFRTLMAPVFDVVVTVDPQAWVSLDTLVTRHLADVSTQLGSLPEISLAAVERWGEAYNQSAAQQLVDATRVTTQE